MHDKKTLMPNKYTLLSIIGFIAVLLSSCGSNPEITKEELNEHITFLSSDSLKGRFPGTPEMEIAAQYIKQAYLEAGLELLGEDGMQEFEVTTDISRGENNHLSIGDSVYQVAKDFVPYSFTANKELEAEVVFAGYGFHFNRKGIEWNDFENIDVKGKWVLMLTGDPEIDSANSIYAAYSGDREKTLTATDAGAAGILLVSGPVMDARDKLISLHFDKTMGNSGVPVINIKREVADELLKNSAYNIAQLEETLNASRQSKSFDLGISVKGSTEVNQVKVQTHNVLAFLEGTDPLLKEEIIVIGAHYDHLGFGGPESGSRMPDTNAVHNGADDNASGVAAIIEIAEKLAAQENKRSVLVIAFSAEEMGLLGSKYFVNHPSFELEQLKAMVNLDMIGRMKEDNGILLAGVGTSVEGEAMLRELESIDTTLKFGYSPDGYGPSDHAAFYAENVPVFFLSTGAHDEYHTPFDDADKINLVGEKQVADYSFALMDTLLNMEKSLTYQENDMTDQRKRGRRGFNVTLGIMPDYAGIENSGLRLDGVRKGGSADKAGMLKGDIIIAIDGKEIKNIYDYMHRLNALEKGKTASVDIIRDGKRSILLVQL